MDLDIGPPPPSRAERRELEAARLQERKRFRGLDIVEEKDERERKRIREDTSLDEKQRLELERQRFTVALENMALGDPVYQRGRSPFADSVGVTIYDISSTVKLKEYLESHGYHSLSVSEAESIPLLKAKRLEFAKLKTAWSKDDQRVDEIQKENEIRRFRREIKALPLRVTDEQQEDGEWSIQILTDYHGMGDYLNELEYKHLTEREALALPDLIQLAIEAQRDRLLNSPLMTQTTERLKRKLLSIARGEPGSLDTIGESFNRLTRDELQEAALRRWRSFGITESRSEEKKQPIFPPSESKQERS